MFSTKWIVVILLVFLNASCTSSLVRKDEKRYQRIEIGNDGQEIVRNFKIDYGDLTIPGGTNFKEIPPVHRTLNSESRVVSIPEFANVVWHSADGVRHERIVPIRQLIKDLSHFYGWKFYFVDDHLDVYLLSRLEQGQSKYLSLEEEKVFSE